MTRQVLRVAWYRFRATFADRRGGYLTVVLLVALVGGLAMGSIAAARRTDSSFSTFLTSTNPSDLVVIPAPQNSADNYSPAVTALLAHLPDVKHVEDASIQEIFPLGPNGLPHLSAAANKDVTPLASVDGLGFTQDRVTVTAGRMADPSNPDEIVMTAAAASLLGVHVGSKMALGLYTPAQVSNLPVNGIPTVKPYRTIDVRVVGLVVWGNGVVYDDIDRYPTEVLFTPALAHELLRPPFLGGEGWTEYGLQLDRGAADVSAVEREIGDALPPRTLLLYHVTSLVEAEAQQRHRARSHHPLGARSYCRPCRVGPCPAGRFPPIAGSGGRPGGDARAGCRYADDGFRGFDRHRRRRRHRFAAGGRRRCGPVAALTDRAGPARLPDAGHRVRLDGARDRSGRAARRLRRRLRGLGLSRHRQSRRVVAKSRRASARRPQCMPRQLPACRRRLWPGCASLSLRGPAGRRRRYVPPCPAPCWPSSSWSPP